MYKILKYFGCFGTYTELPSSSPLYDYKVELLNVSKKVSENNVDKQRLEVNVLHILQRMIIQLKIYDINNVIREFKQLQIQNIWLYAIPKSNPNTLLLLPNSNLENEIYFVCLLAINQNFCIVLIMMFLEI
jgi:hypothetical protein